MLHTLGSAEALGVADRIGSIEVELATWWWSTRPIPTPARCGTCAHYACSACGLRNLKTVYIGGRVASLRGRSTNPLAAQVGGELDTRVRRAAAKAGLRSR